jgi:hypothetical protein
MKEKFLVMVKVWLLFLPFPSKTGQKSDIFVEKGCDLRPISNTMETREIVLFKIHF